MNRLKVAFLTSSDPRINPSARFRVFQFLPFFENHKLIDVAGVTTINGELPPHVALRNVLKVIYFALISDILFVQKARVPKPLFWLLTKLSRVIYDFDDSTFLPPPSWAPSRNFESRRERLNYCLQRCHQIIAGNEYLATYARQFNSNVHIIPTVVTTDSPLPGDAFHWNIPPQIYTARQELATGKIVIGWIGGGEHVRQLDQALPALLSLQNEYGIAVKVVSDRAWQPDGLSVENKSWLLEEEVSDVKSFDIGLMPLDKRDPFLQGKCAFKAIEYMAVGSPVVASAVGANNEAISHGQTGFLVHEATDWERFLRLLVTDQSLRIEMGREAREWVRNHYSLHHVLQQYIDLFNQTATNKLKNGNDQSSVL